MRLMVTLALRIAVIEIFALAAIPSVLAAETSSPCMDVHGRVSIANGSPSVRIWPVGTKRMLAVVPDETDLSQVPQIVRRYLDLNTRVYGDFTICPVEADRAGHMRKVRFAKAANLVVERRKEGTDDRIVFRVGDTADNDSP